MKQVILLLERMPDLSNKAMHNAKGIAHLRQPMQNQLLPSLHGLHVSHGGARGGCQWGRIWESEDRSGRSLTPNDLELWSAHMSRWHKHIHSHVWSGSRPHSHDLSHHLQEVH